MSTMVSLITEKLGQQSLLDNLEFDRHQPSLHLSCSSGRKDTTFCKQGSFEDSSSSPQAAARCGDVTLEDASGVDHTQKQCTCSSYCDILPPKRHRHARSSDVDRQCETQTDYGDSKDSSFNGSWRPTVRSSSVWRSVAGQSLKQFSSRTNVMLPELSPLPIRQSMSSERSTPSESPSPRPASASSGFFDSSQGSLNCTALEGNSGMIFSYMFALSCNEMLEEGISETNGLLDRTAVASSESLPMICGVSCERSAPSVSPFSSDTLQPVRCRSQPSILVKNRRDSKRVMGKKRRWPVCDDHRPKLDFLKMKETAYDKINRTRLRASHHVQFAADTNCTSSECCDSAGLEDNPRSSVDNSVDCSTKFRLSLDSCSSDTYEDQLDAMASTDEINSKCVRIGGEVGIEEETEEIFNIDLENDLDLDQIEND